MKGKGEKKDIPIWMQSSKEQKEKRPFLSEQGQEIEGKVRMGKTRDLFKKIRDIKGTFHAKMGTMKDRNDMDLTETEYIKMWWLEYTEELYKKGLNGLHNHNAVM